MALATGFGVDWESCDPAVFEAAVELLQEQEREATRRRLEQELKTRMGR